MPYEILNLLFQIPNIKENGLRLNTERSAYNRPFLAPINIHI